MNHQLELPARRLLRMPMWIIRSLAVMALAGGTVLYAQQPDAKQVAQERASAERDVPKLVEALDLKPGMTVADVGAGGGSMTVVLGKWIGAGHVFSTDIGASQLARIRDYVKTEGLTNVTVIEGAAASTNLPAECCDAIFMRLVYHHITAPEAFDKSLVAALKPGGRLAIIEFLPDKGSKAPDGVPANRTGHGITADIVKDELTAAGLTHVKTIEPFPDEKAPRSFLALFRKS